MAAAIIDVYRALDQWAPFDTQMDFDNAGFLVGRGEREVRRVLVSLDITEAVAAEAGRWGAELIVSHHPVIFHPVKALTDQTSTGRTLLLLAEQGIGAVCAHTNLDAAQGGVNDCLARALELKCDGAVLKHAGMQAALDYQEVLVKTLVSSHKQKNKGFSSYRVTELVSSQKEDILQRVELILQARQRHRKVAPLALAGIMALLLVCSYSVVVQPAYYPSMEEITEGQYTPVTTWNSWLARESDGDYILYCKGEEPIPVSDKTAGIMLDQGFPLRQ